VSERQARETARVQPLRSRGRWRQTLLLFLLAVGGGAFAVHRYLVPLDVLVTWRKPARLSITTEPAGAILRLDGVALGAVSPTVVEVRRDLIDHVLEATHVGFRQARTLLRYDKTVTLSARLVLPPEPPPVLPPPPPAPAPAPAPPPPAHPARRRR
jgi:hypothetical protein